MYSGHSFAFGGGGMLLFWLLFSIIIFYFIIDIFNKKKKSSKSNQTALDTLELRYAKGEIDVEEYQQIKKNLQA
jgi:putative membrane protein